MIESTDEFFESNCGEEPHEPHSFAWPARASDRDLEATAELFRALADPARLRLLERLSHRECCVTELAEVLVEGMSTISQRLKILRSEGLVARRREGKHIYYRLADEHVINLMANALAHATEGGHTMAHHHHEDHKHVHGANCGHTAIQHGDHVDYLHDGHLHHPCEHNQIAEHVLEVNATNRADCTNGHDCTGHEKGHVHGPNCGHEAVPHGDHTDYLVDGHLHHPHGDHCDNHGPVTVVK